MKCDICKRQINYCFYINDKYWNKAVGKKEGYRCAHCILEELGGLEWYLIWDEAREKSHNMNKGITKLDWVVIGMGIAFTITIIIYYLTPK